MVALHDIVNSSRGAETREWLYPKRVQYQKGITVCWCNTQSIVPTWVVEKPARRGRGGGGVTLEESPEFELVEVCVVHSGG